jgi:hypothetical protein
MTYIELISDCSKRRRILEKQSKGRPKSTVTLSLGYLPLLKQIAEIAKIVKLRHLKKAVTSPSQALDALKYHYRRVSQRTFVEFLAGKYGCSYYDIEAAYKDLSQNSTFWEDIQNKLLIYPDGYGLLLRLEFLPELHLPIYYAL